LKHQCLIATEKENKMRKYALVIGNSNFDDQHLSKLKAPMVDVERLAQLLRSPEIGNFQVAVLYDCSFAEIRLEIANLFADKGREDLVLLYFSGHGLKDELGELHLATKDTRRNRLTASAIESRFIRSEMSNSRARRQILVLDCCFSGAFARGFKGEDGPVMTRSTFPIQGYGRVVLTASNATQYAFEGDQIIGETENSLFTHFLLEGLENGQADRNNDGKITIDEWYEYAYEQIENSKATQRPQKFIDSQEGADIVIAHTRYVGSYLTRNLNPVPNIEKRLEKVANFISDQPTVSLIPRSSDGKRTKKNDSINTVIQGDNLLAMKSIFASYASRIKCVYIEPPYDSGLERSGFQDSKRGTTSKRSRKDTDSSREGEDPWIEMMYPRLVLLRELISDDGVIFISIDDSQLHNVKSLMDYVFSPLNWMCTFIWKRRKVPGLGNRSGVSIDHEYIICYSRANDFHFKGSQREIDTAKYTNPDNDPRGPWTSVNLVGLANAASRPNLIYKITDPQTGLSYDPPRSRGWRYSKEKMQSLIQEGQILWPKSRNSQPRQKRYLAEAQGKFGPVSSVIELPFLSRTRFQTDDGFVFDYPKPVELIKYLIKQIPLDDFTVLDAFAGSGTTGEAILDLNKEDSGKRKFILIEENPEVCRRILVKRLEKIIVGLDSPMQESSNFQFYTLGKPRKEK
jgi:adenine-specific DNA-methyltransferase